MNKILEVKNLSFSYEGEAVLRDVNFEVSENEFVAIIGDNGAGKSTLMNLIIGNLQASAGEIRLFGDLSCKDNHYRDIAYISQNASQSYKYFPTNIEEAVKINLRYLKSRAEVKPLLEKAGLAGHAKKKLDQLSGGQLQRVGLLLALIKDAKLILLDEPTTGIDSKFSLELYETLKELTLSGKTIVLITHHLAEMDGYVDKVISLKNGSCSTTLYKSVKESRVC